MQCQVQLLICALHENNILHCIELRSRLDQLPGGAFKFAVQQRLQAVCWPNPACAEPSLSQVKPHSNIVQVLLWTATIFCAALTWVEDWLSLEYMVVVLSSLQFSSVYRQCVGQTQLVQKRLSQVKSHSNIVHSAALDGNNILCCLELG